jgi:hypothetical protein
MTARYRSNTPRFVDDTVDGEALIMDMVTGNYYSCVGASAVAWNALKRGASVGDTADVLASIYRKPVAEIAPDVERFVHDLVAEELLVETEGATTGDDEPPAPVPPQPYAPLELERFTDLADLILLDPVHDVSEAGWPRPAQ